MEKRVEQTYEKDSRKYLEVFGLGGIGSRLRGRKKNFPARKTSKFFICGSRTSYSAKLAGVSSRRMARKNIFRVSVSLFAMLRGRVVVKKKREGEIAIVSGKRRINRKTARQRREQTKNDFFFHLLKPSASELFPSQR